MEEEGKEGGGRERGGREGERGKGWKGGACLMLAVEHVRMA